MYRHNGKVPRDRKDVDAKIVKSIVNQQLINIEKYTVISKYTLL